MLGVNKFKIILCLIASFIVVSGNIACGKEGVITEVDTKGTLWHIVVKVSGEGTLWVGCSVYPSGRENSYEVDLDPIKLKGSGEVKFNIFPYFSVHRGELDFVVALWEDKISLKECEKKYGKDSEKCKWARDMGFQMEGRLDSEEGTY